MKYFWIVVVMLSFACNSDKKESSKEQKKENDISINNDILRNNLFENIPSSASGITFSNTIKENIATMENLFDYDFFYNGAGVGIEDINNDGLKDIFFTGNQVENKLYLNKGNLVFEDISEKAGINIGKEWANGVTFADVNGDGWMDIYISQGGPKQSKNRQNLLFINQKDLTFKEIGKEIGLNDNGISTQSVFFDYDNDGDLDCLVSNENEFYGLDPNSFYNLMKISSNLYNSATHLYQNNNGIFTDVSKKAGVLNASFGLGVTVSDINNDGWLDIYIANDYYIPDALYINNKNGTFSNEIKEQLNQVSFYGMGVDIADINNDLLQDIFVLDMASSDHVRAKTLMASMNQKRFSLLVDKLNMPYQYMYNSLQLNMGNNKFHNISQQAGLSKTDWSWAGLIVDLDFDGYKDIYVTNGYRRYALDNDMRIQIVKVKQAYNGKVPLEIKQRLYDALPSEKLSNIIYWNQKNLQFTDETNNWGLYNPSFSNGAAYADLDNDGDLDLVVSNINSEAFLYKNNTIEKGLNNYIKVITKGKTSEPFAKVTVIIGKKVQFIETKRVKGYLSATQNDAFFGIGNTEKIDTIRVVWLSGKFEEKYNLSINTEVVFKETNANKTFIKANNKIYFESVTNNLGINFIHRENSYNDFEKEVLLPYKQSTFGPYMAKGDINGDGRDDIFIGGAANQPGQLFIQTDSGFIAHTSKSLVLDKAYEDMEAVFFDVDNDGDNDLYVVSGGNEFKQFSKNYTDRLYINDGSGRFTKSKDKTINALAESGKSVAVIDYDNDGDLDLLIGNRIIPQNYPMAARSFILRNDSGSFTNVTREIAPQLIDFGIINQIIATDFDNDGWVDFIAVGEWSPIGIFRNEFGTFKNISVKSGLNNEKGWWFSVSETDINNDGLKDYIIGNVGTNIKYKATNYSPLKVFGNDFDNNGTFDIVLSNQYNGRDVPSRGLECSSQQMPFIVDKFQTYNSFANASLYDIYGDKLDSSYKKEATQFKSLILINKGQGKFDKVFLPSLAQTAPIFNTVFIDLNNDGYEDAIILGNIYNTEVETPRLDMGTGIVLLSQQDRYKALSFIESGLYISGNAKSLLIIEHQKSGNKYLISGINDEKTVVFKIRQ